MGLGERRCRRYEVAGRTHTLRQPATVSLTDVGLLAQGDVLALEALDDALLLRVQAAQQARFRCEGLSLWQTVGGQLLFLDVIDAESS